MSNGSGSNGCGPSLPTPPILKSLRDILPPKCLRFVQWGAAGPDCLIFMSKCAISNLEWWHFFLWQRSGSTPAIKNGRMSHNDPSCYSIFQTNFHWQNACYLLPCLGTILASYLPRMCEVLVAGCISMGKWLHILIFYLDIKNISSFLQPVNVVFVFSVTLAFLKKISSVELIPKEPLPPFLDNI